MTWSSAKQTIESAFKAAGWSVIHNKNAGVLVVTTIQGDIYISLARIKIQIIRVVLPSFHCLKARPVTLLIL